MIKAISGKIIKIAMADSMANQNGRIQEILVKIPANAVNIQFGQVDSGLDRKYEGSGLGRPLAKGLIDQHQGILDIESISI